MAFLRGLAVLGMIVLLLPGAAWAGNDLDGVRALVARVLPGHQDDFVFTRQTVATSQPRLHAVGDEFTLSTVAGKINIAGTSGVACSSGLLCYLHDRCGCDLSWNCGDQLHLPDRLPRPGWDQRDCPYADRFAYNYCTHGYTMPWWNWDDWQREIDFLALHGINQALIIEGQEQVWVDALGSLGYTDPQVRAWLTLPTHQPWQYMSNMEAYGGPVPVSLVNGRVDLTRKIVTRMRELGIEPVMQGYYGIVPSDFHQRFPNANVHAQGRWCGLKRPDMLDPTDPLFPKLAAAFYAAQSRLYGPIRFYAADPFHEGGNTKGVNIPAAGRAIFDAMQSGSPGSTWVLQSWQANPRQPMLDPLDKTHLRVIDLYCEADEHWKSRAAFNGTPWLWGCINNFGGNTGMYGRLNWLLNEPATALNSPGRGVMTGIAAVPEGSQTNPAIWAAFFDNTWRDRPVDTAGWVHDYVIHRYGRDQVHAQTAWTELLASVYTDNRTGKQHGTDDNGPVNSAICAFPSLDPNQRARAFTGIDEPYEAATLQSAWKDLLAAGDDLGSSDGYRYDLADVTRQVLADLATQCQRDIVKAYKAGDARQLQKLRDRMLGLIDDTEVITATRKEFLLGPWLARARAWGATPAESDQFEQASRELLTDWTTPPNIQDYANRQWAGLLKSFYRRRWEIWLNAMVSAGFDPKATQKQIRDFEIDWTRGHDAYLTTATGDTVTVAKTLWAKYGISDEKRQQ